MWPRLLCCSLGLPGNRKIGQYSIASGKSEQVDPCTPEPCQQLFALASAYLDRVPNGWYRRAIRKDRVPYPFPAEIIPDVNKYYISIEMHIKSRNEG